MHVYGIAMDGVVAVTLHARGTTRNAVVKLNSFYLEANSLGNRARLQRHARRALPETETTRRIPLRVGGFTTGKSPKLLPVLPGVMPGGNTAA